MSVRFRNGKGLTFDDVILVPQFSNINSRSEVDTSTKLFDFNLKIPILAANMDTVCGPKMAATMHELGGLGILHRFAPIEQLVGWVKELVEANYQVCPSIGVANDDADKAKMYYDVGAKMVCIDIAHGDHEQVIKMVEKCKRIGFNVMAGNVATEEGAARLAMVGADIIKVGVGPGSLCSTRVITGHGVPQLTAIINASKVKERFKVKIIADGGIRTSGDIVKALGAGADAVMVGGLLAGTAEAPGEIHIEDGKKYKLYRGSASRSFQLLYKGKVSNDAPEGESAMVPFKGPVEDIIKELVGGIRSGLSYSGCRNIYELHEICEFMEVSSHSVIENSPHLLTRLT